MTSVTSETSFDADNIMPEFSFDPDNSPEASDDEADMKSEIIKLKTQLFLKQQELEAQKRENEVLRLQHQVAMKQLEIDLHVDFENKVKLVVE